MVLRRQNTQTYPNSEEFTHRLVVCRRGTKNLKKDHLREESEIVT